MYRAKDAGGNAVRRYTRPGSQSPLLIPSPSYTAPLGLLHAQAQGPRATAGRPPRIATPRVAKRRHRSEP